MHAVGHKDDLVLQYTMFQRTVIFDPRLGISQDHRRITVRRKGIINKIVKCRITNIAATASTLEAPGIKYVLRPFDLAKCDIPFNGIYIKMAKNRSDHRCSRVGKFKQPEILLHVMSNLPGEAGS